MRGGELGTALAPCIAVRLENVVYNFGKVNQPGKAFLEDLVHKGINVYLITLNDERKMKAWCYKWHIPYTQLWQLDSVFEIPEWTVAHSLAAYYDTDDRVLEAVSSRGREQVYAQKWEQSGYS